MSILPRVARLEQQFPRPRIDSIDDTIASAFTEGIISPEAVQGKRIAIATGSRGITHIDTIIKSVAQQVQRHGGKAFIVPAMGSHGGGTAEGQLQILADYGITPETMGVPVVSSLETVRVGETNEGIAVHLDKNAYESDGILVVNRIKPHTDFRGEVESGIMKMITVGLGKVNGAKTFHSRTSDFSHEHLIQSISQKTIESGKILGAFAILENAYHETAAIHALAPSQITTVEKQLLQKAKEWMPSLPVEQADILIVEQIGKDISGVGMDPNIMGRFYRINTHWQEKPDITRIVVMDLTDESMGNVAGLGLADFCSRRVVDKMDKRTSYLNAVTSRNTICSNIPLHFDTERELFEQVMISIGDKPVETVRLLRIRDTLHLTHIEASEALLAELENHPHVTLISDLKPLEFDEQENLVPMTL